MSSERIERTNSFARVHLDHATVIFTNRRGGVSDPPFDSLNLGAFVGDVEGCVQENIALAAGWAGVDDLAVLHQVHGAKLLNAAEAFPGSPPDADGLWTESAHLGLLVTGADCPPLALSVPGRVAMLHCGWKPLAAGIVEDALALLGDGPLQAAIGPGIGPGHYEVGAEVAEALDRDGLDNYTGGRLDLHGVIVAKLRRAGAEHIEIVGDCTYSDPEMYFSHRRDGAGTGRQAGIAWLN
ncbi:MAG: laccase domain-containing protein [Actinobacteria bacterium]|nr:laccase domain-containing protein [Actinomycetota bacterium]